MESGGGNRTGERAAMGTSGTFGYESVQRAQMQREAALQSDMRREDIGRQGYMQASQSYGDLDAPMQFDMFFNTLFQCHAVSQVCPLHTSSAVSRLVHKLV